MTKSKDDQIIELQAKNRELHDKLLVAYAKILRLKVWFRNNVPEGEELFRSIAEVD